MDLVGKTRHKSPITVLDSLRKSAQDVGDTMAALIDDAKELNGTIDDLKQSLASQEARNASINAEFNTLQEDYRALLADHNALRSSHDDLRASKQTLDSEFTNLTNATNQAMHVIDMEMRKIRTLEGDKNNLQAQLESLKFDLAASDALTDRLQQELEALKAIHANDISNSEQGMIAKDEDIDTKDPAEHIQFLQASIDRTQRRYDRLLAKKESAEQKFYTAYVEWHGFKQWWLGFSNYPGVSRKMIIYNREVKSRAWVPSGHGVGGTGKILRVIEAAEEDSNAFPNVVHKEEQNDMDQGGVSLHQDEDAQRDPKERLEEVCREAERILGSSSISQVDPKPLQCSDPPRDSDVTLFSSEQRQEAENVDDGISEEHADDSFDPEKTQETTPGKSQAQGLPFRFDLSGLNLPVFNRPKPPTSPPRLVSPEPSQVIVIKEESQELGSLLPPATTTPIPLPASLRPKPLATSIKVTTTSGTAGKSMWPPPPAPPSILGKRKNPVEDDRTPGTDGRRPARVEMQVQYMDGTLVPESGSTSTAKKRRGLEDDGGMESPSVRPAPAKGKGITREGSGKQGTLNSRYEINPARNGGVNFAYEEVLRNKEERRKLAAGTCADCIEYYKVVGPMPPRAQAPLWKTPTSSQEDAKTARLGCTCAKGKGSGGAGDEGDEDADVSAHLQKVSRHRHQFAPAKEPPRYWDLGFPDTQGVKEINEAAEEIHQEKERDMEIEARKSDGKYRKR